MAPRLSVAIIGLGSRGCSVFERLVTLAKASGPEWPLLIEIVDPSSKGEGLHSTGQPDYLLLNTLCGEISMFPGPAAVGEAVGDPGPTLFEWVTERGLKFDPNSNTVSFSGRSINPTDFLPRRILGEYLQWFFEHIRSQAPDWVQVDVHCSWAVDVASDPSAGVTTALADGSRLRTDYAFLTVGHARNRADGPWVRTGGRMVSDPYPLPDAVNAIRPSESVAVAGFGLSAMDVIAALTVGRGGRFSEDRGLLQYRRSGAEPRILLFSRSGVPFRARPLRTTIDDDYHLVAFTRVAVDTLRSAGPIDFTRTLLPLLLTEMRAAYHRCYIRNLAGTSAENELIDSLVDAAEKGDLTATLDELDRVHGPFDPAAALDAADGMDLRQGRDYQRWLVNTVRRDLVEAERGLAHSPLKAALDAVRQIRDVLRDAINFGGLERSSLEGFLRHIVPLMNRAVVGPPKERHAELLALVRAGIVRFPFGPTPDVSWDQHSGRWRLRSTRLQVPHREWVKWLCTANAAWPTVDSSANPLIQSLHRHGRIRRYMPSSRHVPAVDVDASLHPVDATGRSDQRLWLIGPLCEGVTFYNHLIPTPGYSRAFVDAHRCVAQMFALSASDRKRGTYPCTPKPIATSSPRLSGTTPTDLTDTRICGAIPRYPMP